jgi:hypothetical protein
MSFPSRYPYRVHSVALALVCGYYQGQPAVWVERDGQMAAGPYAYDEDRVRRAVELYEEQSNERRNMQVVPGENQGVERSKADGVIHGGRRRETGKQQLSEDGMPDAQRIGREVCAVRDEAEDTRADARSEALAFLLGPTCGLKPAEAKRKLALAKGATVEELVVCVLSGGK